MILPPSYSLPSGTSMPSCWVQDLLRARASVPLVLQALGDPGLVR